MCFSCLEEGVGRACPAGLSSGLSCCLLVVEHVASVLSSLIWDRPFADGSCVLVFSAHLVAVSVALLATCFVKLISMSPG